MAQQTLAFELVSPEKLLFSKPVALVTVPGGEGDYGVLPGHAPMITTVMAGVIEVYAEENAPVSDRIFVSGGFAEVTQARCTVLADEATPVEKLNRAVLEGEARELAEKIVLTPEEDRAGLLARQAVINAKLLAVA